MPHVKLFGNLRSHADQPRFDIAGSTVGEVLAAVCASNAALCAAVLEGGALRPHVRVMINGRDIELAQGLDTPVTETDQIAIFPPLAGG